MFSHDIDLLVIVVIRTLPEKVTKNNPDAINVRTAKFKLST